MRQVALTIFALGAIGNRAHIFITPSAAAAMLKGMPGC